MLDVISFDWGARWVSTTDGDTCRLSLDRTADLVPGFEQTVSSTNARGVPIRLIVLDTPERGDPRYQEARAALDGWLRWAEGAGGLRVETYESAGWDRLLGDVYRAVDRGDTASQFMLRAGWDPYVR